MSRAATRMRRAVSATETNIQWAQGTWLLDEVSSAPEVNSFALVYTGVLTQPGITGLSIRVRWSDIDGGNYAILDAAKAITDSVGSKLAVRFVAGRWTPAAYRGRTHVVTYNSVDYDVPLPFQSDGTSGNPQFEAGYASAVQDLAAWCRSNGVRVLHLPWYGRLWAEYDNGADVQSQTGYTVEAWRAAHQVLLNTGLSAAGNDLAVEYAASGHPNAGTGTPNANIYLVLNTGADQVGDLSPYLFHQSNGWQNTGDSRATSRVIFGMQSYGVELWTGTTWAEAYQTLNSLGATYCEVYRESFQGEPVSQLLAEAAAFKQ